MDGIVFSRLTEPELDRFCAFCEINWGEPHPLIHDRRLFDCYYRRGGLINFALASDGASGEIYSVCGFIPTSCEPAPDLFISYILTKKGAPLGLGFGLLEYIKELTGCRTISCNNIRKKTRGLYEFMGWRVESTVQYYRLNEDILSYTLCDIRDSKQPSVHDSSASFRLLADKSDLDSFKFADHRQQQPYKDAAFTAWRYFDYPFLSYSVWLVERDGRQALLVLRRLSHGGASALRVADLIGSRELVPDCGALIDRLMRQNGDEFADWQCAGLSAGLMARAGFRPRLMGDENIIPSYLKPPLMRNDDFWFFTSGSPDFAIFKADGDQDRPSPLELESAAL